MRGASESINPFCTKLSTKKQTQDAIIRCIIRISVDYKRAIRAALVQSVIYQQFRERGTEHRHKRHRIVPD